MTDSRFVIRKTEGTQIPGARTWNVVEVPSNRIIDICKTRDEARQVAMTGRPRSELLETYILIVLKQDVAWCLTFLATQLLQPGVRIVVTCLSDTHTEIAVSAAGKDVEYAPLLRCLDDLQRKLK